MKKTWLIVLAVVALAALTIGVAVPALAHNGAGYGGGTAGDETFTPAVERVATALDLAPAELVTRLQAGETLARIAAAQGVADDTVIEALVAVHAERLALRVEAGIMTREQADVSLQAAYDNAAAFLNADLSGTAGFSTWHDAMEDYCEPLLNGQANRYGGTMNGYGNGSGTGRHGRWTDDGTAPGNGAGLRDGSCGGVGGGFGGRMMGW
jgi:hypothetical protein